jgi:hypothetical protein
VSGVRPLASWLHGTSVTLPTLMTGPFVQAEVPALRQRMNAWQFVSQEPTAFSRAVASVTLVAPVVRPEQPDTRTAARMHATPIAGRHAPRRLRQVDSMPPADRIPVLAWPSTRFLGHLSAEAPLGDDVPMRPDAASIASDERPTSRRTRSTRPGGPGGG